MISADSPAFRWGDQALVNRSLLSVIRHHNAAFRDLAAGKLSSAWDEADQAAAILELIKGFEERAAPEEGGGP